MENGPLGKNVQGKMVHPKMKKTESRKIVHYMNSVRNVLL